MNRRTCWDTNPLVSALIKREGIPRQLFDFAREQNVEVVVSPETLREVADVLRRPHIVKRYGITESDVEEFLEGLREFAIVAPGQLIVNAIPNDPKDNHVLAAAVETDCDFIVSGDNHLLALGTYQSIRILSPRDLLTHLQSAQHDTTL